MMAFVFPFSLSSQQYRFDSYGQAEGLNSLQVHGIAFDSKGFLWVATEDGLFRFLGSQFEYYGFEEGLTNRDVLEVYVDPQDGVWVATPFQLFLLRGNRFSPIDTPVQTNQAGKRHMLALARDQLLVIKECSA
jgi:ligand-binding sensor domain-containing protein